MSKRPSIRSLSVQLLAGVLISLSIALASFLVFLSLGNLLLDHTVYGESFSETMSERQFHRLQNYVRREEISSEMLTRLNAFCSRGSGVYLTVYLDGTLIYESPVAQAQTLDPTDFDPDQENEEQGFTLVFTDGVETQAFLYYFVSDAFSYWMEAVSGIASFLVFSFCFVSFIHKKLRYIQKLRNELDILAGGDLSYTVTVQGHDELSELAAGIDEMRRSILKHQRAEEEIRSANSQLVTAMSHDLRTPLTSLLAFLEILDRDKVKDEEQRRHLIRQSLEKTLSIKSMADKLFEYFLVYTSEWEQPDMEELDADEVLFQFWQEYAFALENQGFTVKTEFCELHGKAALNPELLRRAFDNLYANLVKYADPSQPILIRYCRKDNQIILTLSNTVSAQRDRRESTNIGLNTCRRILRMHNGSFESQENNGIFTTTIILPFID